MKVFRVCWTPKKLTRAFTEPMIDLMIIIVELHLSALASLQAFHVHGLNQVIHSNRTSQDKKFQLAGGNQFSVYKHDRGFELGTNPKRAKNGA